MVFGFSVVSFCCVVLVFRDLGWNIGMLVFRVICLIGLGISLCFWLVGWLGWEYIFIMVWWVFNRVFRVVVVKFGVLVKISCMVLRFLFGEIWKDWVVIWFESCDCVLRWGCWLIRCFFCVVFLVFCEFGFVLGCWGSLWIVCCLGGLFCVGCRWWVGCGFLVCMVVCCDWLCGLGCVWCGWCFCRIWVLIDSFFVCFCSCFWVFLFLGWWIFGVCFCFWIDLW